MVIKIGGITIDKLSQIDEATQLRAGLDELSIYNAIDGIKWMSNLSVEEGFEYIRIAGEYTVDMALSFLSFGIF